MLIRLLIFENTACRSEFRFLNLFWIHSECASDFENPNYLIILYFKMKNWRLWTGTWKDKYPNGAKNPRLSTIYIRLRLINFEVTNENECARCLQKKNRNYRLRYNNVTKFNQFSSPVLWTYEPSTVLRFYVLDWTWRPHENDLPLSPRSFGNEPSSPRGI